MPSPARLKVFRTHSGFYDTIVAAPSQKAALEVWGASQNLFQKGLASVVGDDEIIRLAKSQPGIVLRRMFGSKDPFSADPRSPKITDIPKADRPRPGAKKRKRTSDAKARAAAKKKQAEIQRHRKAALAEATKHRKAAEAEEIAARKALAAARRKRK